MTRCEDACASGSVALYGALYAIEAGRARAALVVGVEKMNLLDTKGVTHALATCSYWPEEGERGMTFPGLFAEYAKGYAARYGLSPEVLAGMLASVSAHCYRNGLENPLAHFGKGGPSDRLGLIRPRPSSPWATRTPWSPTPCASTTAPSSLTARPPSSSCAATRPGDEAARWST